MTQSNKSQRQTSSTSGVAPAGDMNITGLVGREVYTGNGVFVGEVSDVKVDFTGEQVAKVALDYVNEEVVDVERTKRGILLPYRWVQSVGDIVLVTDFVESLGAEGRDEE